VSRGMINGEGGELEVWLSEERESQSGADTRGEADYGWLAGGSGMGMGTGWDADGDGGALVQALGGWGAPGTVENPVGGRVCQPRPRERLVRQKAMRQPSGR
jgi:hypothetical protein